MNPRKPFLLSAVGLIIVAAVAFWWFDSSPEAEKNPRLSQPGSVVPHDTATADSRNESNVKSADLDPTQRTREMGNSQPAKARPDEPPLADQTAKELLVRGAEVLDTVESRIGFSNRVIRKTLYRTDFKYPIILKTETLEISPEGNESTVSEKTMVGDHVMVQLPEDLDRDLLDAWATSRGYEIRHQLRTAPIVLLSASEPTVETVDHLQSELGLFFQSVGEDPEVQVVEPDYLHFPTATPNDPAFSDLWGLHNAGQFSGTVDADIDAPEAWDITTDASSVLVGVIDTGVDRAHPDLSANMWTNPLEIAGNGVDDDNNGFIDDVHGWDFYEDNNDPSDGGSHGTHCAGTIGAVGSNGIGVVGVSWNVSMVGIRFLGPTGGSTSDAIESINYATIIGADLTSNSWGGGGFSTSLLQAIENGASADILFVAAAGNESVDNDTNPHYPSSYTSNSIISVAASDRNDGIASFSNWGRTSVDLAAPGVAIYSTIPNSSYGNKSGTSMATPHVSGALALLRSVAPQLPHLDLKQQLLQTVDPVAAFSQNTVTGGRMNLNATMQQLGGASLRLTQYEIDDSAGNDNGIINPDEPIDMVFEIANQGVDSAVNVTASLVFGSGTEFSSTGNTLSLGTIASGQSATSPTPFRLTADALTSTPHQEDVSIRLEWGSAPRESKEFPVSLTVSTSSTISGRITQSSNGAPLSGARVSYSGPVSGLVLADTSGDYEIEVIDGNYTIVAEAPGFATSSPRVVTSPPNLTGVNFSLGKPELQVNPLFFSLNLLSGQTATRNLSMTNTGDSILNWSLTSVLASSNSLSSLTLPELRTWESDPDAQESMRSETVIPSIEIQSVDLTGVRIGFLTSWNYSTFESDLDLRGAAITSNLSFPLAANALDNFDIILVDDEIASASPADMIAMREWIEAGGGIVIMGDNSDSVDKMNSVMVGSGIAELYRGSFDSFTVTNIEEHPTTTDVASVYASQAGTYLNVTGDAVVLMREPDGVIHAAASTMGSGNIVAVGNEFASASSLNTGDTRLFANQVIDWLHTAQSWLSTSPESGTLNPGATTSVTVTVDATNLVTGSYSRDLIISSNDPISPIIEVPVDVQINGFPSITLIESQILFGNTAIGRTSSETVTVRNDGSGQLLISSLTPSTPQFTASTPTPVSIDPGAELQIPVVFAPTSVGTTSATLSISSNDPNNGTVSIPLSGQGFVAPVIGGRITRLTGGSAIENATISYTGPTNGSVSTDANGNYSFEGLAGTYTLTASASGYSSEQREVTIPPDRLAMNFALSSPEITVNPNSVSLTLAAGDSDSRTVTISNQGNVTLDWSSVLAQAGGNSLVTLAESISNGVDPDLPSRSDSEPQIIPSLVAPLVDITGIRVGVISPSVYNTFVGDLTSRGAEVVTGLSFPITSAAISSFDVLIVDDSITFSSTADTNVLRQWLSGGGGLFLIGDNSASMAPNNAVLNGTGIEAIYRGGFSPVTADDIATHPTTVDIASVYGAGTGAYCTVTGDAAYLAREADGKIHSAAGTLGSGRVVVVGDELPIDGNFTTGDARQFANQIIDWLSFAASFDWISIAPTSGSISESSSTDVTMEFDATGLLAGNYSVDWIISSNDANTPQLTVPVSMQVNGAPNIEITPDSQLQYSTTYTGQVSSLPLTIFNTGSDDLTISSITSSAPQFSSSQSLPLVIAPGENHEVNVLFSPDTGNTFSGILTILSDDPTNGSVTIALAGTGLVAPSFEVNPTALNLSLLEGTSTTETLEITNNGGANLEWTTTVAPPSDLTPIFQVDWDSAPHVVGQRTAIGGPNAPSTVSFGNPTVRQSAGGMPYRPLELVGGSGGSLNYSQLRFTMGDRTDKVVLEFDIQKLDSDDLTVFFDVPTVHRAEFNATNITFSGITMPYDSTAVNRIRIEYEIDTMTTSLSLNGGTPVTVPISLSSATALRTIRFSANDQGTAGGTLIDNLIIGTEGGSGPPPPVVDPDAIFDVDWDGSPHVVNQRTAIGGTNSPSRVSFGNPTVRQTAGAMSNRPLELIGGTPIGNFNYGQIQFDLDDLTDKVTLEFDLQKLDSDDFTVLFDTPYAKNFSFSNSSITFFGVSVPYNSSVVNRIKIEVEVATLMASVSVNGATPVPGAISNSGATGLRSIRFSSNDQGSSGGVLIDNVVISADSQGASNVISPSTADWLTLSSYGGTVGSGQTQPTVATIDTSSLSVGDHSTTIEFLSNDPQNPAVSLPVMISIIGVPEIDVESPYGTSLSDGVSSINFPNIIETGSITRQFRIRNLGSADLTGLTASLDGAGASEFFLGNLSTTTLTTGQATVLDVTFNPGQLGNYTANLRITSNDADENPFDIEISGAAVPDIPEIEVEVVSGSQLSSNGIEVSVPDVAGSGSSELTFTVRNVGTGYLRNLETEVVGADANRFSAEEFPLTTLIPGQETSLRITFTPREIGERFAMLRIMSNDADENPFEIPLRGNVVPSSTTLEDWAESFGLSGNSARPTADNDGDLIPLLQEYAFNLDPTKRDIRPDLIPASGTGGLPVIRLVGDRMQVEYIRRNTDPNLQYRVLFGDQPSFTAVDGLSIATETETVTPINIDWSRVIVNDSTTTATSSKRFGTIEVEMLAP